MRLYYCFIINESRNQIGCNGVTELARCFNLPRGLNYLSLDLWYY